jgi:hypothetical protein
MHQMSQFQYINEHHYELGREHKQNASVLAGHGGGGTAAVQARDGTSDVRDRVYGLSKQVVDFHIVGSAKTCMERVRAYQEEAKVNYIVMNMKIGAMSQQQHEASMRRFAKEVMPAFAA